MVQRNERCLIYNQNHLLNYELSDYDKIYEFVENKYLLQ